MLIGKDIFVIFLNLFAIGNFRVHMLIYRNAEEVHHQRKFGNTCPKPKPGRQRQTIGSLICMETSETEH